MNFIYRLFCIIAYLSFWNAQASSFGIRKLDLPSDCQITIKGVDNENRVYGFIESASIPKSGFQYCLDETLQIIAYPAECKSGQTPVMNKRGEIAGIRWKQTTPWISKVKKFKSLFTIDVEGTVVDIEFPPEWPNPHLALTDDISMDDTISIIAFNESNQILIANASSRSQGSRFAVCSPEGYTDLKLTKAYTLNNDNKILGRKDLDSNGDLIPTLVLYDIQSNEYKKIIPDDHILYRILNDRGQVVFAQISVAAQIRQTMEADHKTPVEIYLYFLDKQKNNPSLFMPEAYLWDSSGMHHLKDFIPLEINNQGHILGVKKTDSLKAEFAESFLSSFSSIPPKPSLPDNCMLIDADNNTFDIMEILKIGGESDWSEITPNGRANDSDSFAGRGIYKGEPAFFLTTRNDAEE